VRSAIFPSFQSNAAPSTLTRRVCLALVKFTAVASFLAALHSPAQSSERSPLGAVVPHRYLVAFRNGTLPGFTQAYARIAGAHLLRNYSASNIALVQADPETNDDTTLAALAAQPNVILAVHDRIVSAHTITVRPAVSVTTGTPPAPTYDTYYTSTHRTGR